MNQLALLIPRSLTNSFERQDSAPPSQHRARAFECWFYILHRLSVNNKDSKKPILGYSHVKDSYYRAKASHFGLFSWENVPVRKHPPRTGGREFGSHPRAVLAPGGADAWLWSMGGTQAGRYFSLRLFRGYGFGLGVLASHEVTSAKVGDAPAPAPGIIVGRLQDNISVHVSGRMRRRRQRRTCP